MVDSCVASNYKSCFLTMQQQHATLKYFKKKTKKKKQQLNC